jgi:hypothetical protein
MAAPVSDPLFIQEQRRFRRLEVSLPVWITTREAFEAGTNIWEMGTTRDISLGGAKVSIPFGEEEQWQEAVRAGEEFIVKIESRGKMGEPIPCFVRSAVRDMGADFLVLGVQFQADAAPQARGAALNAGLASLRARRSWQFVAVAAAIAAVLSVGVVSSLRNEVAAKERQIPNFAANLKTFRVRVWFRPNRRALTPLFAAKKCRQAFRNWRKTWRASTTRATCRTPSKPAKPPPRSWG